MRRAAGDSTDESENAACMSRIERCPPGKLARIVRTVDRWHRTCCSRRG